MNMVQIEISRHDWASMWCGCRRTAEHIPHDFLAALAGPPPEDAGAGWADSHAYVQSNLMQPAVATASIAMAALADGAPVEHRHHLLAVLQVLSTGEQDDIADECLKVVQGGTWILYEEIVSGRSIVAAAYAYELLDLLEDEADRLKSVQRAARENLPTYLR
ncbi:hypothetical protein ABCR94_33945 [Streptomyces sp. 21So2-11]|uniref:hypothetical protein n=1 Tax=Streptomyces sp. 21So2-11 TaxID=3144408 RepID=UPI003219BB2A